MTRASLNAQIENRANHGLIIPEVLPEDFVQGTPRSLETKFGAQAVNPEGNWEKALPDGERQNPGYETSMCVPSATSTNIETIVKFMYGIVLNLSERMIAKLSAVDPLRGSDPKKVADTIYRQWSVLEKEWPTSDAQTLEEFYAEIPEELKTLALARRAEFEFGYSWVPTDKEAIRAALKSSPVCMSVPAWYQESGKYYRPQGVIDGHWTLCYGINENDEYLIFDSYPPYKKVMRADFKPAIAMKYHVTLQTVSPSAFRRFIRLIKRMLGL